MTHYIIHIDMNSYFATIEQQANPHLRGKPIVVGGKEGSRAVIVAASREAKKFGVKTAMLMHEAKRLCPHLIFVEPDGTKYQETTDRFFGILKRYTEVVELYSIDEAFMDVTGYVTSWDGAKDIAVKIKQQIRQEIGEWVSCSVGIAPNKLLAKVASDYQKPDGLVVITEETKFQYLDSLKLIDIWGIGPRLNRRLEALGITNMSQLRTYPQHVLLREFGPHYAVVLKNMSYGIYDAPVVPYFLEPEIKSVGRSYTLSHDTGDKKEIFSVLLHLAARCGRRLRREGFVGRTLEYYLRYADFTHVGFRLTLPHYTSDELLLYDIGRTHWEKFPLPKMVRLVGLRVSQLVPTHQQLPLWQKDRRRAELLPYVDKINDRYGKLTIKPGRLLDTQPLRHRVGGFKFDME